MTNEEGIKEFIKAIKRLDPPKGDVRKISFIMKNQDYDLLAHISIPPPYADTEELTPKDYQIKDVMLGRPTVDTTKVMITIGMKEVFRHMDQDELELIIV